jgi:membrane protein YdbS with pleckstrin-like domain
MYPEQLLDPLAIPVVFVAITVVLLAVFEVGFRIGRWWQERTPDETEGPTGVLVGSLLALMAFLLAVTMGMAADRFDTRRGLVLDEANAIGTTYLRAGYLPQPYAAQSQALLREYVPLRVNVADRQQLATNFARSTELHAELWAIAEDLARTTPDSVVLGLYIDSLNETIDLHSTRATAIIYARVPETVLFVLIIGAALTMGMVGYSAGLTRRRSPLGAVVLVVVLAAVLTLVVDLDRPRDGFLQVNQQPLLDLQKQLGPP